MKRTVRYLMCIAAVITALTAAEKKPLTNDDVLKMAKAELPESTIILAIQSGSPAFDTTTDALIALKSAGISPAVIEAMLTAGVPPVDETEKPPSEAELEEMIRKRAVQQSKGIISVASFKKTDGQQSRERGIESYAIEFEALVQFSADCIWRNVNIDTALTFQVVLKEPAAKNSGGWGDFLYISQNPGIQVKRGSVFLVTGSGRVTKSESGWRLIDLARSTIVMSSAGAITQIQADKNEARARAVAPFTQEDLVTILKRQPSEPENPDQSFTSDDGKVTGVYPAGFKKEKPGGAVAGRFVAPDGEPGSNLITVTCASPSLFNRNPSLESTVKRTVNSIRSDFPGVVFTDPVRTKLSGEEARTFAITVIENGVVRRKAVTIAVSRKHILGVILHSTPESFEGAWDAYRRVCDSYSLAEKDGAK